MSPQPKAKHRSPAQVRAGKAYAAAGRAAQAKTRAAAIKKTGKPPPRSKAQHAASVRAAGFGRAAQAARRAGKKPVSHKKAALPCRHAPLVSHIPARMLWLPGCDDEQPVCAVTAVANHLLAATGIAASDAEMLALHLLAGGDDGARIETVLDAAVHEGLAGHKLILFGQADRASPGTVCGLAMGSGYHAVLAHPYGMVSWGLLLPWAGRLEEAWYLDWEELP